MAIAFVKLDNLFMLLVPELLVLVTCNFPREFDVIQSHLSIVSHSVVVMSRPLISDPRRQRQVFFVLLLLWHPAMALVSLKLDKLFLFHVPLLVKFRHGSQKALLKSWQETLKLLRCKSHC
jgi:hypothetical protein